MIKRDVKFSPSASSSLKRCIVVLVLPLFLLSINSAPSIFGGVNSFVIVTNNSRRQSIGSSVIIPSIRGGEVIGAHVVRQGSKLSSTSIPTQQRQQSETERKKTTKNKTAVIIGGGPVGLATAITLSNEPHCYDVTVYESTQRSEFQRFDPSKAYLYLITGRGQDFTKKHPKLQNKLREHGVPSTTAGFVTVPADIDQPIPEVKNVMAGVMGDEPGYWIPRHTFANLLLDAVEEQERDRRQANNEIDDDDDDNKNKNKKVGSVTCYFGIQCLDVFPSTGDSGSKTTMMTVRMKNDNTDGQYAEFTTSAKLIVGADGMNSMVRQSMNKNKNNDFGSDAVAKKFRIKRYRNPATDLRLKALQFPPKFTVPYYRCADDVNKNDTAIANDDGDEDDRLQYYESEGSLSYTIQGINTGPRNYVKLGLLPMKDNDSVRPANVITRPDHDVWKIDNGEDMRVWFQKNFPRLNFNKESDGGMISDKEWDRFAKAEGIQFPHDQYSPGLQVSFRGNGINEGEHDDDDDDDCGVALVGDSAHAFPPSIGQGINSGLADVIQLDKSLKGDANDDDNVVDLSGTNQRIRPQPRLCDALNRYESRQGPQIKSLIRLARFGAPYQYNQPHYIDRVRKFLWSMNVIFRLALNKVSFGLFSPPMMMMVMKNDITYRQMARRADLTTAALMTAFASLLVKIVIRTRI